MINKTKLVVLISGRGTNLQSLIDACAAPGYPAEITLVISNRPKAAGLDRAVKAGIRTAVVDHKDFETREDFDAALHDAITTGAPDYVCLAGFMRILTDEFVTQWSGRMINIHPSLLPAFKGLNVHERMIDAGVHIAGCSVHFVSPELDSGPVIGQAALAVAPGETADSLADRILELEHKLYPAAIKALSTGAARLSGARVVYNDDTPRKGAIINPPAE